MVFPSGAITMTNVVHHTNGLRDTGDVSQVYYMMGLLTHVMYHRYIT